MSNFSVAGETKLLEVENHLANNQYISGGDKPDANDIRIFRALNNKIPDHNKYPSLFAWFGWINMFAAPFHDKLAGPAKGGKASAKPAKEEDDEFDPFADDDNDEDAKALAEKKKKEADEKKKKS
mmetsp:Transcript_63744/g.88587  ORF Transcript_63744/g.88587 Transcript_63744/m.88587 type:complete len:125 (-) Transcript_63744:328-702(-)